MLLKSKDFRDKNQPGSYEQPLKRSFIVDNHISPVFLVFGNFFAWDLFW